VNIEDITESIIEESGYLESATEQGYPQYSWEKAVDAAEALESVEEVEMLEELSEGGDLYDIYRSGIGEELDRLEEAGMVERPSTGEFVTLTRLSRTYLQYYRRNF
jgi:hypothetical protein